MSDAITRLSETGELLEFLFDEVWSSKLADGRKILYILWPRLI